jgi:hypothetical protein
MLVAKATVLTAVVVAAGTVSVLGSLLAGQRAAAGNGFTAKHGFLPTRVGSRSRSFEGDVELTCGFAGRDRRSCALIPTRARSGSRLASGPVVRGLRRVKIDRFGLGDWWPRPDQAAAGALDHLPADQWPRLAAKWLAAGFDSLLLRQLAELRAGRRGTDPSAQDGPAAWAAPSGMAIAGPSGNADVPAPFRVAFQALDLMPEAMRSIGFDPAPADEEFVARCQSALDVVQHDLDVTGYGQYQIRARLGRGWPATVYLTLPDGSYWGGGEGISRETKDLGCSAARLTRSPPRSRMCPRSSGRSAPSTAVIRTRSGTARNPSTSSTRWHGGDAPRPGIPLPRSASSAPRSPRRYEPSTEHADMLAKASSVLRMRTN